MIFFFLISSSFSSPHLFSSLLFPLFSFLSSLFSLSSFSVFFLCLPSLQHAHMLKSMCACCRHTRRRFESTHGKRFESTHGGHRQFCLKNSPRGVITWPHRFTESNHWMLPMFKFENRLRTTCSRFLQSFALPDKPVKQQLLWGNVGGNHL